MLTVGVDINMVHTVCPRSSDPFCIVNYYMKWVTTSWIYSRNSCTLSKKPPLCRLREIGGTVSDHTLVSPTGILQRYSQPTGSPVLSIRIRPSSQNADRHLAKILPSRYCYWITYHNLIHIKTMRMSKNSTVIFIDGRGELALGHDRRRSRTRSRGVILLATG